MSAWTDFVQRAARLGYIIAKDPDGVQIVGFPGGYVAPAPGGKLEVLRSGFSSVHSMPDDVRAFMKKIERPS